MIAARRLLAASLVLACSVGVAACGSSEDTQGAAAAVSLSFLNSQVPAYGLTSKQTACLGEGVIKDFGVEKAISYKFLTAGNKPVPNLPIKLPQDAASTFATTYIACADPGADIENGIVERIAPKNAAAEKALRDCLSRNLTSTRLHTALTNGYAGRADSTLNEVFSACSNLG